MAPKKTQSARKPRTKKAKRATSKASTTPMSSRTSSQLSQSIFGRSNRLDDMFSQEPEQQKRKPFEEDEGFFYKRTKLNGGSSGTRGTSGGRGTTSTKKVSTPVSKLNQALAGLSDDSDDVYTVDVKKQQKLNVSDSQTMKLLSPIRPRYEGAYKEPSLSSDEYIEQVSHHKVDLTGGSSDLEVDKPMKKKINRRASYQNRGKRILSIGNGLVGLPHEDVGERDYYKLLDTSLPEPHRMKQLLIWCISKKLQQEEEEASTKKNKEDPTIRNIAKVIKEEVLQDLRDGVINTSWYSKRDGDESNGDDNDGNMISNEILLPNPLNNTTKNNIRHFSKQLIKLKREKDQWKDLFKRNMMKLNENLVDYNDIKVDEEQLNQYVKNKPMELVVNEDLIGKLEAIKEEITDKFLENIESSVDRLYNTTNKVIKVGELIERYKKEKLDPKIFEITKRYIDKSYLEESSGKSSTMLWPLPPKVIGMKEILKGIMMKDETDVV